MAGRIMAPGKGLEAQYAFFPAQTAEASVQEPARHALFRQQSLRLHKVHSNRRQNH
jgi:hypothetical protein